MSNALDDLIAKVEADLDTAHHHAAVFPSESAGGHCTWHDSHKASNGSLDAALAIHNAVLPGWGFDVSEYSTSVSNRYTAAGYSGYRFFDAENIDDNPARAWLLAVLRAMKEGKDA